MKKFAALLLSAVISVSGCLTSSFAQNIENTVSESEAEASEGISLAASPVLAFPGAQGGGQFATGGRGGTVYHVTNLNDSGTGSFRDAVSGSNRIVVFDVGGTIELKSNILVSNNVTIAGQTAPGGMGITLKNYKLGMSGDNIIVRYISSRPGTGGSNNDYDAWGGAKGSNSIIDHCSLGWAIDEQWGLYSNNMDYTVQYTIIGPANSFGGHSKGIHGFGIMFGKGNASWHHNLIVHNISRNFRGKVEGTNVMDYINNVVYDWGYQTAYGTFGHLNYANNYYKAGNSTTGGYNYLNFSSGSNYEKYKFYLEGNKMENADGTMRDDGTKNWSLVNFGSTYNEANGYGEPYYRTNTHMPITVNGVDTSVALNMDTADEAFDIVTQYAGAGISPECKPKIDLEVCSDAINGTGNITGTDVNNPGSYASDIEKYHMTQVDYADYYPAPILKKEIVDSDNDGMPDEGEIERGLNPNDASDANGNYRKDEAEYNEYTNIEYYLNDLTVNSFPEGVVPLTVPAKSSTVTVDPSADEVEGESYKTITDALAYIKSNTSKARKTIYVAPGTYNENITVDQSEISIRPVDGSTGEIKISSLTVTSSAEGIAVNGISLGSCTVSADKATFEGCKFLNTDVSVTVDNKARAYLKNCTMSGTVAADSRVVLNGCTISADDFITKSTRASGDSYGMLVINSVIIGTGSTLLGDVSQANGQVVYYNCTMSGVTTESCDSESKKKIRVSNCDTGGTELVYVTNVSEYDFWEKFSPFTHLKQRYGASADNWNPDGFDELTPQKRLQEIADSVSVPTGLILADTEVVHEYPGDTDVKFTWTSSDTSCFNNNTILIGDYGSGVKYAVLTLVVSKEGLTSVEKKFNIIVGSVVEDDSNIIDFEKYNVGDEAAELKASFERGSNNNITWGVVDNINDENLENHNNIFQIKQSGKTGDDIYNFIYNFEEKPEKVVEADFDIFVGELSPGGYFEVYLRGDMGIGQLRITGASSDKTNNIAYYVDGSNAGTLASNVDFSKWYRMKMIVSTMGITNGTAPKVDYYIYDGSGNKIAEMLNAAPAGKGFSAENANQFVTNQFQFRPNRGFDICEFYIDNILYKDLTEVAEKDAEGFESSYVMNEGDRLPVYGNQLSDITWRTVDGQTDVVNSDGTINYDKCGTAVIKVKGTVSYGENLKGTAETDEIVLIVNGTGVNTDVTSDKYFSDTDDFSGWYKEYNQAAIGILLDDTANVYGNSTAKVKLPNKAVFKKFSNPANSGKVTFTTDFLTDSSGRTFRIYLENAATEDDGKGYGTAAFGSTNIFYHMTDIGGTTYVITSDTPSASDTTAENQALGKLEPNKWYRIQIDLDFDSKTAVTNAYLHGTDGTYNPEAISTTPVGTVTSNLISKTPLELKQIRLVRTAAGNVYFDNVSVDGPKSVTGVLIAPTEVSINIGATYQLYTVVSPSEASDKSVSWSSSNTDVATVDENGLVTAKAAGNAVITVKTTDGEFTAVSNITVKSGDVTGVAVTPTSATINAGETYQLNVAVTPSDASDKSVSWSSGNTDVATVDENGLVTAKAAGNAVITVRTTDGGFTAVCNITVKSDEVLLGDVDGNEVLEVRDAVLTLNYVLNKGNADIEDDYIERMNVMGNEEITAADAAYILNMVLSDGE